MCTCYLGADEIARRGVVHEPLGRGGAMVVVCERCASDECAPPKMARRKPDMRRDRAEKLTAHRQSLSDRGLCINGAKHPRPGDFKLCEDCRNRLAKYRESGPGARRTTRIDQEIGLEVVS